MDAGKEAEYESTIFYLKNKLKEFSRKLSFGM
jgi:hypothetical protein